LDNAADYCTKPVSLPGLVASPTDRRIREIVAGYPGRGPRVDLDAVEALRLAAGVEFAPRSIVVVGTNGKTSTATYLERILRSAGLRTGLTTSPHIRSWGERIAIDGVAVADELLLAEVQRLHRLSREVADSSSLRFFDLVTLAAATIFARGRVDVGIYEAGIGGRLDATRLVAAPLVVLTSIGIDHAELLGSREVDVLREKLGVAPRGGRVVSAELPAGLGEEAEAIAGVAGFELLAARDLAGPFLARNRQLATFALRNAPFPVGSPPDESEALAAAVPGRMQRLRVEGVDVILDAAHNPQGWSELAGLLPPSYAAVVSISRDRSVQALALALREATHVFVTEAWEGRSYDAARLGSILAESGLDVEAFAEPAAAFDAALRFAKAERRPLVVFGSSYLLPHALSAFGR
jgi:dihydrofolate synthase/folylpolyglutamate synthase